MTVNKSVKQITGPDGVVEGKSNYFMRVYQELKKVTWPIPSEVKRLTSVVIGIIVACGIYMWVVSTAISWILQRFTGK